MSKIVPLCKFLYAPYNTPYIYLRHCSKNTNIHVVSPWLSLRHPIHIKSEDTNKQSSDLNYYWQTLSFKLHGFGNGFPYNIFRVRYTLTHQTLLHVIQGSKKVQKTTQPNRSAENDKLNPTKLKWTNIWNCSVLEQTQMIRRTLWMSLIYR